MKKCCLNCYWYEEAEQVCLLAFMTDNGPMISVYNPTRETRCSEYKEAAHQ